MTFSTRTQKAAQKPSNPSTFMFSRVVNNVWLQSVSLPKSLVKAQAAQLISVLDCHQNINSTIDNALKYKIAGVVFVPCCIAVSFLCSLVALAEVPTLPI